MSHLNVGAASVTSVAATGAVTGDSATLTNAVTAGSFVKQGGTSSQFLKADGSIDSTNYSANTLAYAKCTMNDNNQVNASTSWTNRNVLNTGGITYNVGGFTIANNGITVPQQGLYQVIANCRISTTDYRTNVGIRYYIDNVAQPDQALHNYIRYANDNNEASDNLVAIYFMNANQRVNLRFRAEGRTGITCNLSGANSTFTVWRIG